MLAWKGTAKRGRHVPHAILLALTPFGLDCVSSHCWEQGMGLTPLRHCDSHSSGALFTSCLPLVLRSWVSNLQQITPLLPPFCFNCCWQSVVGDWSLPLFIHYQFTVTQTAGSHRPCRGIGVGLDSLLVLCWGASSESLSCPMIYVWAKNPPVQHPEASHVINPSAARYLYTLLSEVSLMVRGVLGALKLRGAELHHVGTGLAARYQ